jgi:photosystem II stability/assembly factor-like uncharacterized protein
MSLVNSWTMTVLTRCMLLVALLLSATTAHAEEDWILLEGPRTAIVRLWALPGGLVFAADADKALFWTADGGDSWQMVPPPAGGFAIMPDTLDASVAYGVAADGLYKTTDGGASWRLVRTSAMPMKDFSSRHLAISPIDHDLVYLVEPLGGFEPSTLSRSSDGGQTWVEAAVISRAGSPCVAQVSILMPHPLDVQRVFSDMGCYAGRNFGTRLLDSLDRGTTWRTVFPDGRGLIPGLITSGGAVNPARLYLTTSGFMASSGARLYRSDDDGASWTPVLDVGDPRSAFFGGLVTEPDQPDTVYVAVGRTPNPEDTGVRMSVDAGMTWSFLGRQDIGWVNDLVRAADGTLLAATNEGIWRFRRATSDSCCAAVDGYHLAGDE